MSQSPAKTESVLQTPEGYTGIYVNWNVDVDGITGGDDPWDFGTTSQYPALKIDFNKDGSTEDDIAAQRMILLLGVLPSTEYTIGPDEATNETLSLPLTLHHGGRYWWVGGNNVALSSFSPKVDGKTDGQNATSFPFTYTITANTVSADKAINMTLYISKVASPSGSDPITEIPFTIIQSKALITTAGTVDNITSAAAGEYTITFTSLAFDSDATHWWVTTAESGVSISPGADSKTATSAAKTFTLTVPRNETDKAKSYSIVLHAGKSATENDPSFDRQTYTVTQPAQLATVSNSTLGPYASNGGDQSIDLSNATSGLELSFESAATHWWVSKPDGSTTFSSDITGVSPSSTRAVKAAPTLTFTLPECAAASGCSYDLVLNVSTGSSAAATDHIPFTITQSQALGTVTVDEYPVSAAGGAGTITLTGLAFDNTAAQWWITGADGGALPGELTITVPIATDKEDLDHTNNGGNLPTGFDYTAAVNTGIARDIVIEIRIANEDDGDALTVIPITLKQETGLSAVTLSTLSYDIFAAADEMVKVDFTGIAFRSDITHWWVTKADGSLATSITGITSVSHDGNNRQVKGTTSFTINVSENPGTADRVFMLALQVGGSSGSSEGSVKFTVTQAGAVPAGLIPITTLEQLNAMRYDLDGDGVVDDKGDLADEATATTAYKALFPGLVSTNAYTGYKLENNLDFDGGADSYSDATTNKPKWTPDHLTTPTNAGWVPIGTFTGTFDGQGKTISNLFINRGSTDAVGLFGIVGSGGSVKNVGLEDPVVTGHDWVGGLAGLNGGTISASYVSGVTVTGSSSVGGLVGGNSNGGTISASYVSGGTVRGGGNVGGLVGGNSNGGTISASYVSGGTVTGTGNNVGGLVGGNDSSGTIIASYVSGVTVTGNDNVGGLVGANLGTITASYVSGVTVTGNNRIVGGLAGYNSGPISASYVSGGTVTGSSIVGGLVGGNDSSGTIIASYVSGVTVTGNDNVGGLVGANLGTITASYAGGKDYANLVGTGSTGTVTNSYYQAATVPAGNAAAKTASQLRTPTDATTGIYADWDADLDNADGDNDPTTEREDFWRFGGASAFPKLWADFNGDGTINSADTTLQTISYTVPTVAFGSATYSADEATKLTVTVEVSAAPGEGLEYVIPVEVLTGGSTAQPADYQLSTGTNRVEVTISGTATSETFDVTLLADNVSDNGEIMKLGFALDSVNLIAGTPAATLITINNASPTADLIPITTLEQLYAIRYDLDGDGVVDNKGDLADLATATTDYKALFPGLVSTTAYTGYKLENNLDFNVSGSYSSPTTAVANKLKWTSGAGWAPIGFYNSDTDNAPFTGTFDGQGKTISNLFINRGSTRYVGLFGYVGSGGSVKNVGLKDPVVTGYYYVGGLAGGNSNGGTVSACYVSGGTVTGGGWVVGGLVGWNNGTISAIYVSGVTVTGNNRIVGGLVGWNDIGTISASYVSGVTVTGSIGIGGLVGANSATIRACYVSGVTVTGSSAVGGLVGSNSNSGTITASYAGGKDYANLVGEQNGTAPNSYYQAATSNSGLARTASELKTPTGYTASTIYEHWNVDVDGITGGDDPWDFGTGADYPVLKIDFNRDGNTADDVKRQRPVSPPVLSGADHTSSVVEDVELSESLSSVITDLSASVVDANAGSDLSYFALSDFESASSGTWYYQRGSAAKVAVNVSSGKPYLLLQNVSTDKILFTPSADYYYASGGTLPSFKVRAFDYTLYTGSGKTILSGAVFGTSGDTLSTNVLTYSVKYTPANDAPSFALHPAPVSRPAPMGNGFSGSYSIGSFPSLPYVEHFSSSSAGSIPISTLIHGSVNLGDGGSSTLEQQSETYSLTVSSSVLLNPKNTSATSLSDIFSSAPALDLIQSSTLDLSALTHTSTLSEIELNYTPKAHAEAIVEVVLEAEDAGGEKSSKKFYMIVVDDEAPKISGTSPLRNVASPASYNFESASPITLTFTEPVDYASSAGTLRVIDILNSYVIFEEPLSSSTSELSFNIDHTILSIDLSSRIYQKNSLISLQIDGGSFVDFSSKDSDLVQGGTQSITSGMSPPLASPRNSPNSFSHTMPYVRSIAGRINSKRSPNFLRYRTPLGVVPPRIFSSTYSEGDSDDLPLDGASSVPTHGEFFVTFDEAISFIDPPDSVKFKWSGDSVYVYNQSDLKRGSRESYYAVSDGRRIRCFVSSSEALPSEEAIDLIMPSGMLTGILSGLSTPDADTVSFTTKSVAVFKPASSRPSSSSTGVGMLDELVAVYSEALALNSSATNFVELLVRKSGTSGSFKAIYKISVNDLSVSDDELEISLPSSLSGDAEYEIIIPSGLVQDIGGNTLPAVTSGTWRFTTATSSSAPVPQSPLVAPSDLSMSPSSGSFVLSFDQPVEKGTGSIGLYITSSGSGILYREIPVGDASVVVDSGNPRFVRILHDASISGSTLDGTLPGGQTFYVTIPAGAFQNYTGTESASQQNANFWRFTTATDDSHAPSFVSLSMPDGTFSTTDLSVAIENAAVHALEVGMQFDEPVSYNTGSITLVQKGMSEVLSTVRSSAITYTHASQSLSFVIPDALSYNTEYTLRIPANMFEDASGNGISSINYHFWTRLAPPVFTDAQDPSVTLQGSTAALPVSLETSGRFTKTQQGSSLLDDIAYSATSGKEAIFAIDAALDKSKYNHLIWSHQTSATGPGTVLMPGSSHSLTFADLGFSGNTLHRGTQRGTPVSSDLGIHTYRVWQDNEKGGRLSDTTTIDLVILERALIVMERIDNERKRTLLTDPIPVIQNSSSDTYECSFGFNDVSGYTVLWSGEGITYSSSKENSNDYNTLALFVPQVVLFSEGSTLKRLSASVQLTNSSTLRSYTQVRSIDVSKDVGFLLRLTPTGITPGSSSVSTVCQQTGKYDISEFIPSTTYVSYSRDELSGHISNFKRLALQHSAGLQNFLVGPSMSSSADNVPWYIDTDVLRNISGERTMFLSRIISSGSSEVSAGFASFVVNQAPDIEILDVSSQYCSHSPSDNVSVRIIRRGPTDAPLVRRSNKVGGLAGRFNMYKKATAGASYPSVPDSVTLAKDFVLSPAAFYSKYAGGADSVLVKLEYVSDGSEDVGTSASATCQGRGSVEFTVYKRPSSPDLAHSAAAQEGGEALYCENTVPENVSSIEIQNSVSSSIYRWYKPTDLHTAIATGVSYTPLASEILKDVSGDASSVYNYAATQIQYSSSDFSGCESATTMSSVRVVGVPELSLSEVRDLSSDEALTSSYEVCIADVKDVTSSAISGSGASYSLNTLRIVIDNTKVLSAGGTFAFTGSSGLSADAVDDSRPSLRTATFDPLAAIQGDDPSIRSVSDYVDGSSVFSLEYVWTNKVGSLSCSNTVDIDITVHGLPSVDFSLPSEVCVDADPVVIRRLGSSVTTSQFYIDKKADGSALDSDLTFNPVPVRKSIHSGTDYAFKSPTTHSVTYVASGDLSGGCQNFVTKEVTVLSSPDIDFSPVQGCQGKAAEFTASVSNTSNLSGGLSKYSWTYPVSSEATRTETFSDPLRTFTHTFSSQDTYKMTLEATTVKGCVSRISKDIEIGADPLPVFYWEGRTVDAPVTFHIYEKNVPLERISGLSFSISQEGTLVGSEEVRAKPLNGSVDLSDITRTITAPGIYDVTFSVRSEQGCSQSTSYQLEVLPSKRVISSEGTYAENFSSGSGGWYVDSLFVETRSVHSSAPEESGKPLFIDVTRRSGSWQWGTPDPSSTYITSTASNGTRMNQTDSAWLTNVSSAHYGAGEVSFLYSPFFDISQLERPVVSFDMIYNFASDNSGAVLQYSLDGGTSWAVLGSYSPNSSVPGTQSWYTHQLISSLNTALGSHVGWSGASTAGAGHWITAFHSLGGLPAAKRGNVQFRFVVATSSELLSSSRKDLNGLGLDNFRISNSEKLPPILSGSPHIARVDEEEVYSKTFPLIVTDLNADVSDDASDANTSYFVLSQFSNASSGRWYYQIAGIAGEQALDLPETTPYLALKNVSGTVLIFKPNAHYYHAGGPYPGFRLQAFDSLTYARVEGKNIQSGDKLSQSLDARFLSSGSLSYELFYTNVQDLPELSGGSGAEQGLTEGSNFVRSAITLLSDINAGITDQDPGSRTQDLVLRDFSTASGSGRWHYRIAGRVSFEAVPALSSTSPYFVLLADDELIFVPDENYAYSTTVPAPGFTIHAFDSLAYGSEITTGTVLRSSASSFISVRSLPYTLKYTNVQDRPVLRVLRGSSHTAIPIEDYAFVKSAFDLMLDAGVTISDVDPGARTHDLVLSGFTSPAGSGSWYYKQKASTSLTELPALSNASPYFVLLSGDSLVFQPEKDYSYESGPSPGFTLRGFDSLAYAAHTSSSVSTGAVVALTASDFISSSSVSYSLEYQQNVEGQPILIGFADRYSIAEDVDFSRSLTNIVSDLDAKVSDADAGADADLSYYVLSDFSSASSGVWYYQIGAGVRQAVPADALIILSATSSSQLIFVPSEDYYHDGTGAYPNFKVRAFDYTNYVSGGSSLSSAVLPLGLSETLFSVSSLLYELSYDAVNDKPSFSLKAPPVAAPISSNAFSGQYSDTFTEPVAKVIPSLPFIQVASSSLSVSGSISLNTIVSGSVNVGDAGTLALEQNSQGYRFLLHSEVILNAKVPTSVDQSLLLPRINISGNSASSGGLGTSAIAYELAGNSEGIVKLTLTAIDAQDGISDAHSFYLVILDMTGPQVDRFESPDRDKTRVPVLDAAHGIRIRFSEPVSFTSSAEDTRYFRIKDGLIEFKTFALSPSDAVSLSSDSRTLSIDLSSVSFPHNTRFSFTIDHASFSEKVSVSTSDLVSGMTPSFTPPSGEALFSSRLPVVGEKDVDSEGEVFWQLQTPIPQNPPTILSSDPAIGSENLSLYPRITITFDQQLEFSSPGAVLEIKDSSGKTLRSIASKEYPGRTSKSYYELIGDKYVRVSIDASEPLPANALIQLYFPASVLQSTSHRTPKKNADQSIPYRTVPIPVFRPSKSMPSHTIANAEPKLAELTAHYSTAISLNMSHTSPVGLYIIYEGNILQLYNIALKDLSISEDSLLKIPLPYDLPLSTQFEVDIPSGLILDADAEFQVLPVSLSAPDSPGTGDWHFTTNNTSSVSGYSDAPNPLSPPLLPADLNNAPVVGRVSVLFDRFVKKPVSPSSAAFEIYFSDGTLYRSVPISSPSVQIEGAQSRIVDILHDNSSGAFSVPLPGGSTFYVTLPAGALIGISSPEGSRAQRSENFWRFTTDIAGDDIAPVLTSVYFPDGALRAAPCTTSSCDQIRVKGVAVRQPECILTFSEPIEYLSDEIEIYKGTTLVASIPKTSFTYQASNTELLFKVPAVLDYDTEYTLRLASGMFSDISSRNTLSSTDYTFKTLLDPPLFVGVHRPLRILSGTSTQVVVHLRDRSVFAPTPSDDSSPVADADIAYQAKTGKENILQAAPSVDPIVYQALKWGKQTGRDALTGRPELDMLPSLDLANPLSFEDLGFSGNIFHKGAQGGVSDQSSDLGIHTYYVWQESTSLQRSDTTIIDLIVLLDTIIIENTTEVPSKRIEDSFPTFHQADIGQTYTVSHFYNDQADSDYEVLWIGEGVTYKDEDDTPLDYLSKAAFAPAGVVSSDLLSTLSIHFDMRNNKTGRSYRSARQVRVSQNRDFSLYLTSIDPDYQRSSTRAITGPPAPDPPTAAPSELPVSSAVSVAPPLPAGVENAQSICQHSGQYYIAELRTDTYVYYSSDGFTQPGLSDFKRLRVQPEEGVGNLLLSPPPGNSNLPWRMNSNAISDVASSRILTIERVITVDDSDEIKAGSSKITVYQAPKILFETINDRYCVSSPARAIKVTITRGDKTEEYTSSSGRLQGILNIYSKFESSGTYAFQEKVDLSSGSPFALDPGALYSYAGAADSVLIRLEYVSHPDEDKGEESACRGRGHKDFVIYGRPPAPDIEYLADESGTTYVSVLEGVKSVLYCEDVLDEGLLDIEASCSAEDANCSSSDSFEWRSLPLEQVVSRRSLFRPSRTQLLNINVPGNATQRYTFEASLIRYSQGETFSGCASLPSSAYVTVIGKPEIKLESVISSSEIHEPFKLDRPPYSTCVGVVDDSNKRAPSYKAVTLKVHMDTLSVFSLSSGGASSVSGSGFALTSSLKASFHPLAAVRESSGLPSLSIEDYTSESTTIPIDYSWTNTIGERTCRTTQDIQIQVHGLPRAEFLAPTQDFTQASAAVAVCVNEAPFEVRHTNSTNKLPRFYVDGRLPLPLSPGTDPSALTFASFRLNPDSVRSWTFPRTTAFPATVLSDMHRSSTDHVITYIASNTQGCRNFATTDFTIHSVANQDFVPDKGCQGVPITFGSTVSNLSEIGGSVSSYAWKIWPQTDPPTTEPSFLPASSSASTEQILESGKYIITLRTETAQGCTNQNSREVKIGVMSMPEFYWEGNTAGEPLTFHLYESHLALDEIGSLTFSIHQDASLIGSVTARKKPVAGTISFANITQPLSGAGLYDVTLEIESLLGCVSSTTKKMEILPRVHIPAGGELFHTFFPSANGWYTDTLAVRTRDINPANPLEAGKPLYIEVSRRANSWQWGTPHPESTFIVATADGGARMNRIDSAWLTNVSSVSYGIGEQAWLYSPSFDISELQRPMVSFDLIHKFGNVSSGSVLQYSVDDGRSWSVLGHYTTERGSTGLSWYTHLAISSNPGEQSEESVGWSLTSGSASTWHRAKHKLDMIPQEKREKVRFRFAFSSSADEEIVSGQNDVNGMGIDNFQISERSKVVLIEEFSSELSLEAKGMQEILDNYASGKDASGNANYMASQQEEMLRITYYSYPENYQGSQKDRFYHISPEDVNARHVYYGLSYVPSVVLEGTFENDMEGVGNSVTPPWTLERLNQLTLSEPDAQLSVELEIADEQVSITAQTFLTPTGIEKNISGEHKLLMAIVEDSVRMSGVNGKSVFSNVMRKLLPNSSRTLVHFDGTNKVHEVQGTWTVLSTYLSRLDPSSVELYVVAFIQDVATKRIYQAARKKIDINKVVTLGVSEPSLGTQVRVFPNPASHLIQIELGRSLLFEVEWKLFNIEGEKMKHGLLAAADRLVIPVDDMAEGHYILQILQGREVLMRRHVIIQRD